MPRDLILFALSLLIGVGTIWYASNRKDDLLAESMEQVHATRRQTAASVLFAIVCELVLLGLIVAIRWELIR